MKLSELPRGGGGIVVGVEAVGPQDAIARRLRSLVWPLLEAGRERSLAAGHQPGLSEGHAQSISPAHVD